MKNIFSYIEQLFTSLVFIVIGIFFLTMDELAFIYIFPLLGFLLMVSTYMKIINIIVLRKKQNIKISEIILNSVLGIFLILKPELVTLFLSQIFGLYTLIQSIVGMINFTIYYQNKLKGKWIHLFTAISTFIFALLLLLSPIENSKYFAIINGIYLMFYGISDLISYVYPKITVKIPLPIIFTMFLPKVLLKRVTKELVRTTDDINGDLEILIHLAKSGSAGLGHVEFSFEDKVYSYGCYNYHSRRLFGGIGDGIYGVFDHDSYIKYCVCEKDRIILSYGVKLTSKEKEKLRGIINKFINNNTERWYPDMALYDNNLVPKNEFKEMSNQIYAKALGKFYRFTNGKYKTFFVLRTNCVAGTDEILSHLGIKLFKLEGIISPGTYYKFLDDEFLKRGSKVISKKIYNKTLVKKLNYKYKKKNIEKILY